MTCLIKGDGVLSLQKYRDEQVAILQRTKVYRYLGKHAGRNPAFDVPAREGVRGIVKPKSRNYFRTLLKMQSRYGSFCAL